MTVSESEIVLTADQGAPGDTPWPVALDAATLAALETITVLIQSGQVVGLDATTLAALESITATVSGTVALDAPTLAALENITATLSGAVALDAPTLAALEQITATIANFPSSYPLPAGQVTALTPQTDALTDTELRATPVPVALDATTLAALETITVLISSGQVVGLDAASLAALENIVVSGTVTLDGPTLAALENISATVSGTVALDAPTLAALENISATVSGTVALDSTTLAALETITVLIQSGQVVGLDAATLAALESIVVSGTVALDAPTLAALENITAVVSGTVALDATTLAALESITATVSGTVNVGNFPAEYPLPSSQVQTDALTDAELRASDVDVAEATKRGLLPYAQRLTASDSIVPSAGKRIELVWCLIVPSGFNEAENLVTISMTRGGVSTNIYATPAVGRSAVFLGDVDEPLVITLENAWPVSVNLQYREV